MNRFVALATISAAILSYQVLLTRLFAIVQWHHFAFMAISIALLGFGVSAAALALMRRRVEARLDAVSTGGALLFAVTSPVAFFLAQRVPFNALELVWQPAEILGLGAIYLILAVPFTAGATCIGVAFLWRDQPVGRIYFWNLLGSAAGALGIVGLLTMLPPVGNLVAVSALGLIAGVLAALSSSRRLLWTGTVTVAVALIWLVAPPSWTALVIAEQKSLAMTLNVAGTRLVEERFGPLGLVSVVESPDVPFRSAPGLSLNAPAPPPEQIALFTDADAARMLDAGDGDDPASYLRFTTGALVYDLVARPDVLVLGAGGGRSVAQALAHDARHVDAVEPNADITAIVAERYAGFSGGLYGREDVAVHVANPRSFLAATQAMWDVIVVDGGGGSSAGLHGLSETYLLTVEAVRSMLRQLKPGGWISITQPFTLPPRATPKLMLTALTVLEHAGLGRAGEHVIVIRGLATTTLLIGRDPATPADIAAAAAFAQARSFDLVYHAGMAREAANRFNVLAEPVFHDTAMALAGPERDDVIARYKFDIRPARDDRPYFHDFLIWQSLPELLALRTSGGAALLELGKLILVATLVQAIVISLVLILLPLWLGGLMRGRRVLVRTTGLYFTAIGLAFFLVEIAFIQTFILYLGHPTYALAIVIAGFLVFASCGAGVSERLAGRMTSRFGKRAPAAAISVAVAAVVVVALLYLIAVPTAFTTFAGLGTAGRALIALTLIAPLAFFMGMPFPLGLTLVRRADAALVPWAWGVNGCASVVSAVLAMLLAMHLGFAVVVIIALVLYGLAALIVRGVVSADTA